MVKLTEELKKMEKINKRTTKETNNFTCRKWLDQV